MAFVDKDKVKSENKQHGKPLRPMTLSELRAAHECFVLRSKAVAFAAWQVVRKKGILQVLAPLVFAEHKREASNEHASIVKAACATLLPVIRRMPAEDKVRHAARAGVSLSIDSDSDLVLAIAVAKRWEPPPSLSCYVFSLDHKV